uniref:Sushi domain-containing protein n=1 Tax=Caenorhabditis japonica TaxID=281687 RepID=A0A8R1IVL5_CAEJA
MSSAPSFPFSGFIRDFHPSRRVDFVHVIASHILKTCALGFDLIGSEERTCLSDGSWSDEPPICAIDVAFNKPVTQSSGNAVIGGTVCTTTEDETKSFWEVDLLGEYSIRSISITLGAMSSPIVAVEAIETGGAVHLEQPDRTHMIMPIDAQSLASMSSIIDSPLLVRQQIGEEDGLNLESTAIP